MKIFTGFIATIVAILIMTITVMTIRIIVFHNNYNKTVAYVAELKQQNTELNNENETCNTELNTLKQSILDKAPDEILVDDIARYIHSNFPIIPAVLYNEIAIQIATLSHQENISPELIVGVVQVESAFNPMAISSKNARGLMQVMPMWAKHFNLNKVCDLHNIDVGISTGIKVLKVHIEEEDGDISEGLYKYVNKDRSYIDRVYTAMGKFVIFRGPVADNKGGLDDSDSTTTEVDSGSARYNQR